MTILLNQVGKRYQRHWIFKGISYTFEAGRKYAILGANGSGKSTLLRIAGGMQQCSTGTLTYSHPSHTSVPAEQVYRHVSYCAPGMDMVEELSLTEFLTFHFTFKKILPGHSVASVIGLMGLSHAGNKFLHEFSSGMKQRVKLAQAFFSDSSLLLLDEPCSNLDLQGVAMYQQWLEAYSKDRTVIIASNDEREYTGITATISMQDYKS